VLIVGCDIHPQPVRLLPAHRHRRGLPALQALPGPYLRALDLLSASPDHTLVFEDSTISVQACVAARMPVIAIADESREAKLLTGCSSLVIRNYKDPKLWTELAKLDT